MNYDSNSKESVDSEIIFGGWDNKYKLNNFSYFPIISNMYWAINIHIMLLDNIIFNISFNKVLIDSGTSLIMLPE